MINYRDQLYAFHFSEAQRYDPVFNGWSLLDLTITAVSTKVRNRNRQTLAPIVDSSVQDRHYYSRRTHARYRC